MLAVHPLIALARDASPEARADLMSATTDQLLNDPDETPAAELALFGQVLAQLYPYARQDVRERLSAAMAQADWAPKELVLELAHDNEAVALPVISFCPVLDEDGLVDIVKTCGLEHRKSVAGRDNISERVSHELISLDDPRVFKPLIENATARISVEDFRKAMVLVADRPELIDCVASRPDLPASMVATVYALAGKEAREAIIGRLPGQLANRLTRLAEIVCSDAVAATLESDADSGMLDAVRTAVGGNGSKIPSPGALLAILLRGDRKGFLRGVAAITNVNGPSLARRMSAPDTEFVTLVCKAAGFEQSSVASVAEAFRADTAKPWAGADERVVAITWMRHSKATARTSLLGVLDKV